jgi:hypothetical protein
MKSAGHERFDGRFTGLPVVMAHSTWAFLEDWSLQPQQQNRKRSAHGKL